MNNIDTALGEVCRQFPLRTGTIYKRAHEYCQDVKEKCQNILSKYMADNGLDPTSFCFVAIGSVGRMEALDASDLDLLPVVRKKSDLQRFKRHDSKIRKVLEQSLNLHVSEGKDLTACVALKDLTDQKTVGGEKDSNTALTKRVLLLTEGTRLAGDLSLAVIRTKVLECYGKCERTSGRHVLSLCNDIARYYRTLCIEYKAKVDVYEKDWCTRNLKLRHSRKFWYFATVLSIVSLAEEHLATDAYTEALVQELERPPVLRLASAAKRLQPLSLTDIYERYAYFLEFMAKKEHREALAKVNHADRYNAIIENPFPCMKLNSDLVEKEMIRVIGQLPAHVRENIYKWFLL